MTYERTHRIMVKRKTPGELAYEADCLARREYLDGTPRKTWQQLAAPEQDTWERNPTPRNWSLTSRYEPKEIVND